MSYKIEDFTTSIIDSVKVKASIFLRYVAETIVQDAEPITPKDTGDMRSIVLKEVVGTNGKVKWVKDYAAIQETKQFKRYTTPGTGSKFAEKTVKKMPGKTEEIARKAGLL